MISPYVPATEQLVVDYGLRDFTIADPDGFGVRFGTRIEAR